MSLKDQLKAHLPKPLLEQPRFLLWKSVPSSRPEGKPRKVPYYANGNSRSGKLDEADDLAQLATFAVAIKGLISHKMDGIGFALAGEGIGVFDLDHCLNRDHTFKSGHPGEEIVKQARTAGAYIEISPSGRGLHIIGPSSIVDAYSKDGLEYWGKGRYITVTGDVWSGSTGWISIEEFRGTLPRYSRPDGHDADNVEEFIPTPRLFAELRSALSVMDAGNYNLWINMGQALKNLDNKGGKGNGKLIWFEWSRTFKDFSEEESEFKWEGFDPHSITYRSILGIAAKEYGWENPRKKGHKSEEDDDSPPAGSGRKPYEYDLSTPKDTEFILDGFMDTGVAVIAGTSGAGKSTNLIPLFASAAHLMPEEWGIRPELRRRILWVTEAPRQAEDTMLFLSEAEGAAPKAEFKDWFRMYPSILTKPKTLVKDITEWVNDMSYPMENGFIINPVVVLDTVSANIDMENESDNTEVGKIMTLLKERLPGISISLIGHTSKALANTDISSMRGAQSWIDHATSAYRLVYDEETQLRYLTNIKARFALEYDEISFGTARIQKTVKTRWGTLQTKYFLYGIPCRSSSNDRRVRQEETRQEQRQEEREERKEQNRSLRQQTVLDLVGKWIGEGRTFTKNDICKELGGNKQLALAAIETLIERSELVAHPVSPEVLQGLGVKKINHPGVFVLLPETNFKQYCDRIKTKQKG